MKASSRWFHLIFMSNFPCVGNSLRIYHHCFKAPLEISPNEKGATWHNANHWLQRMNYSNFVKLNLRFLFAFHQRGTVVILADENRMKHNWNVDSSHALFPAIWKIVETFKHQVFRNDSISSIFSFYSIRNFYFYVVQIKLMDELVIKYWNHQLVIYFVICLHVLYALTLNQCQ